MSEITAVDVEVCPHCGARYEDVYSTFASQQPDKWHKTQCTECGKEYEVMASYQINVTTRAIP